MTTKRLCQFFVVNFDELFTRRFQFADAGENALVKGASLQLAKPTLNRVQPGHTRGREVQLEPRVLGQPGFDFWRLVSRAVIQDQVQVQTLRSFPVDLSQEV